MKRSCLEGQQLPIEPPADMAQYSKSPSNTGQSSPTLSEVEYGQYVESQSVRAPTFVLLFAKRNHVAGCYFI